MIWIEYIRVYKANLADRHLSLFQRMWRTDVWLSSTSDTEKCVRLCVGVKSKFLYQDADVLWLLQTNVVVECFVCGSYDKVLIEMGKFFDNLSVK